MRAAQPEFFGIECRKDDRVPKGVAPHVSRDGKQRRGTRSVVISPVVHLAANDAEMIEVRGYDDEVVREGRTWYVSDDVPRVVVRFREGAVPAPQGADASMHEGE